MSAALLSFHEGIKEEYNALLAVFNIIFYGYGDKREVLGSIFGTALIVDCRDDIAEIEDQIYSYYEISRVNRRDMLLQIGKTVGREDGRVLVLLNYHSSFISLNGSDNLKIIITIEGNCDKISLTDTLLNNFVFRDLTTLIKPSKHKVDRNEKVLELYNCLGPRSKKAFKAVVEEGTRQKVSLSKVFNREKRNLLIMSYSVFKELLIEFYDHKILKDCDGHVKISLNKKELLALLDKL